MIDARGDDGEVDFGDLLQCVIEPQRGTSRAERPNASTSMAALCQAARVLAAEPVRSAQAARSVSLLESTRPSLARSAEQPEATLAEIVVTPCKRVNFSQRAVASFDRHNKFPVGGRTRTSMTPQRLRLRECSQLFQACGICFNM
jgi:hypothetical protein